MKIAQIVSLEESVPPKHKNGLEFVVSWLTEELVKRGHDVTLFAPGDSKTKAKLISLVSKGLTNINKIVFEQPYASIWNATLVASMSDKFDIIHSHAQSSIVYNMPFLDNIPVIETIHHPCVKKRLYNKNLEFIAEQYRQIHYVSISNRQLSDFKKNNKHFYGKYTNIYNGILVKDFEFNDKPKDYLFFIGYINKNKGADVVVRIAKKLGMKLILAGVMTGEEEFFKNDIEPFLDDKIKYVGPVNFKEKNELYKNAYATLAPIQWDEPFGLTIVESQACGTPVISFDRGASSEIIENGKTGFVVKTEKEMIDAISKVDQINRKDCRKWIEDNFSVKKMVDEYENLYKSLIKK